MRDLELTPHAVAEIRRWILLLAADATAPAWNPVENYSSPDALRAAAAWLVDNGHSDELNQELVGVLLALFSSTLRAEVVDELGGRVVPRDAA